MIKILLRTLGQVDSPYRDKHHVMLLFRDIELLEGPGPWGHHIVTTNFERIFMRVTRLIPLF